MRTNLRINRREREFRTANWGLQNIEYKVVYTNEKPRLVVDFEKYKPIRSANRYPLPDLTKLNLIDTFAGAILTLHPIK